MLSFVKYLAFYKNNPMLKNMFLLFMLRLIYNFFFFNYLIEGHSAGIIFYINKMLEKRLLTYLKSLFKRYIKCFSLLLVATRCIDDETVDCAKLSTIFNICQTIHKAKLVCAKFCNLCDLGKLSCS
jgi:hypothetical protein